jgi:hypothetical protein
MTLARSGRLAMTLARRGPLAIAIRATGRGRAEGPAGASIVADVMGVLDEAIREHLELRRRRGADPGAVAREENEVLGPAHGTGAQAGEDRGLDGRDGSAAPDDTRAQRSGAGEELAPVGEETAEFDMRTVLDADQPDEGHGGRDRTGDDRAPDDHGSVSGPPEHPRLEEPRPEYLRLSELRAENRRRGRARAGPGDRDLDG